MKIIIIIIIIILQFCTLLFSLRDLNNDIWDNIKLKTKNIKRLIHILLKNK
jgi:hypothetical protein